MDRELSLKASLEKSRLLDVNCNLNIISTCSDLYSKDRIRVYTVFETSLSTKYITQLFLSLELGKMGIGYILSSEKEEGDLYKNSIDKSYRGIRYWDPYLNNEVSIGIDNTYIDEHKEEYLQLIYAARYYLYTNLEEIKKQYSTY